MFFDLAETLPRAAAEHGAKTALIAGGRSYSYGDLLAEASRVASGLAALGVAPGDRVTLYLPNGADWVAAYYGILQAGAVANSVNVLNTPDEVLFIIGDCGAKAVITSADRAGHFLGASLNAVIATGGPAPDGTLPFDDLPGGTPAPAPVRVPGDIAHIGYTSGTTGRPKGAAMSHRAVSFNATMTAQMHLRTASDIVVTALPMPHVYGNIVLNATFRTGGTLVLHPRFVEAEVLQSIHDHRATLLEGVPTMYFYLLAFAGRSHFDVTSLTRCTVGGQSMPLAKMEEVEAALGCRLIELWGMTELAGLGATHPAYGPARLGSIGIALPFCEVRVASLDGGGPLPRGEPGELQIRGPIVMSGYWNNDAATAEVLGAEGWLSTGDIARIDGDGFIFIVDRRKEMILTAGYNVYPAELERVLAAHPDVAMAAVGKEAHAEKGEVAIAYVVLKAGAKPDADGLLAHCRTHLAAYKVPRAIRYVADFPKTSTGKILRRELHTLDTP